MDSLRSDMEAFSSKVAELELKFDHYWDADSQREIVRVGVPEKVSFQRKAWPDPSHTSPRHERTEQFAYEIAVRKGFVGTRDEWLEYLKGPQDSYEAHLARKRLAEGDRRREMWVGRNAALRERHPLSKPAPQQTVNPIMEMYADPRRPLCTVVDVRDPLVAGDLWLKAQVQLSRDVAAEIERTRVEVPSRFNKYEVRAALMALIWALLLAGAILATA